MPLRPEEQALLDQLAVLTHDEDPVFARGLAAGNPCPPVEHRRRDAARVAFAVAVAATLLAVAMLLMGWLTGGLVALFAAAGAGAAARRCRAEPAARVAPPRTA